MICNNCCIQEHTDCDNRNPSHRAEQPPSWCNCQCRKMKESVPEIAKRIAAEHGEILERLGEN